MTIVEGQKIKVRWHGSNRNHYESKGYTYTKAGDEFIIDAKELPKTSHVKVDIVCDNCGKLKKKRFDSINQNTNRTFCNHKCYGNWLAKNEESREIFDKLITKAKTSCFECNKSIEVIKSEFDKYDRHFCDRSCFGKTKMRERNPNPKKGKMTVLCEYCGEVVKRHESQVDLNKWHFCSRGCYSKFRSDKLIGVNNPSYNSINMPCSQCGEITTVIPYYLKRRKDHFCCQECYYQFRSIHYSGENHPQFGTKKSPEQIEKMRSITIDRHQSGGFPQTKTGIHKKVNSVLDNLSIKYENEYPTKYYSIDIHLVNYNLFIEVMGDYWHANPLIYEELEDTNQMQRKDIKRDKSKLGFMKNHFNTNPLYLWESDINNNIDTCIDLIKEFISNNGNLVNYQSYNYSLVEGNLSQINDLPAHFERDRIVKKVL